MPTPSISTSKPSALADRGDRFLAKLIDGLAFGLVSIPFWLAGGSIEGDTGGLLMLVGFIAISAMIVYQAMLLWKEGQTIGKRAMKIRIVSFETGKNAGFEPNVFRREIVNGLLGLIPFYGLIDVLLIFREDKRCVHDLIAGTTVVKA